MSAVPHIVKKREGSSWNNWCVNYEGLFKNGKDVPRCKAGIEYGSVAVKVDFTTGYSSKPEYKQTIARPCFRHEHPLTNGCAGCRFPNTEEIREHEEESMGHMRKVIAARTSIINDLEKRNNADDKSVLFHESSQSEWDNDGPTKFVSGQGAIECPVCKTGKLSYSRAGYNGHVHARCSTPDCVAWME